MTGTAKRKVTVWRESFKNNPFPGLDFWLNQPPSLIFEAIREMVMEAEALKGRRAASPDFIDLLRCLNKEKARYLIVGGYAISQYTEPRYTRDLDIWIGEDVKNKELVFKALVKWGAPMNRHQAKDFVSPGSVFFIGAVPNRIDIICTIVAVDFDTCYKRRKKVNLGDVVASYISLEDLIANKKAAGRLQDLADAEKLSFVLKKKKKR
jgi:hypothetical protein